MERRRAGRPAHEPTAATRKMVVELVQAGETVIAIAKVIGLSAPTLRAHYPNELKAPRPQINFGFVEPVESKRAAMPGAGRPPHVPTQETRDRVEILLAGGMKVWQIAAALELSEPVLRECYAPQLDAGRARKRAAILEAMYRSGVEGNVSAQRAFLAQDADLDEPPPVEKPVEPLGKKAAAHAAALTAHEGTDWAHLLPN